MNFLLYSGENILTHLRVLEENHYYPFGLKHENYNTERRKIAWDIKLEGGEKIDFKKLQQVPNSGYQYKYNGKEWQDELGLNMYAMDMRQYDPAIARWVVQDPVVHHNFSPYSAFDNNPVYWADPSGADAETNLDSFGRNKTDRFGNFIPAYMRGEMGVVSRASENDSEDLSDDEECCEGQDYSLYYLHLAAKQKAEKEGGSSQDYFDQYLAGYKEGLKEGAKEVASIVIGGLVVKVLFKLGKYSLYVYKINNFAKGVTAPKGWITQASKKGGGTVFKDPSNPHNIIRQMPGNPNSPNVLQQNPYVKFMKDGKFYDVNGKVLPNGNVPGAHIPLNQFDISKMPKF